MLVLNQSEAEAKGEFTLSNKVLASWLDMCRVVSSAKRIVSKSLKP